MYGKQSENIVSAILALRIFQIRLRSIRHPLFVSTVSPAARKAARKVLNEHILQVVSLFAASKLKMQRTRRTSCLTPFVVLITTVVWLFRDHVVRDRSKSLSPIRRRWEEVDIVQHLASHPDRAYFADLFRLGGFQQGIEVGVADGRFSEHFLKVGGDHISWHMVEPFPNAQLKTRFHISPVGKANFLRGTWAERRVGRLTDKRFSMKLSTDTTLLNSIPDMSVDFVYLDGAHDYTTVKAELPAYFQKVRSGGVLAGHDYCNYGQSTRFLCTGCAVVPRCQNYTEFGIANGKGNTLAADQNEVVTAVHEWLADEHPNLRLYHTLETFTRQSLKENGMDHDLILTSTRNPSWFLVKP